MEEKWFVATRASWGWGYAMCPSREEAEATYRKESEVSKQVKLYRAEMTEVKPN